MDNRERMNKHRMNTSSGEQKRESKDQLKDEVAFSPSSTVPKWQMKNVIHYWQHPATCSVAEPQIHSHHHRRQVFGCCSSFQLSWLSPIVFQSGEPSSPIKNATGKTFTQVFKNKGLFIKKNVLLM